MSKTYLILILLVSVRTYSQTKIDTLNNETIIKLTKSKLPGNVITQKINTSFCSFDISVDGLIKLKESQVSDSVINLMIQTQVKADAA